jgi:plasmid stabilization system protein ParE
VTYRVRRHAAVERDILDLATWIARDSRPAAYRFLDSVEDSIRSLASMPGRGGPKRFHSRRLAGVRSLAVKGFPSHLVLYQVVEARVSVLAVVHGARRYRKLLQDRSRD